VDGALEQVGEALRDQLLAPWSPAAPLYWMHLVAALLLAVLWHVWRGGASPASWRAFRGEHLGAATWWHRSARLDYAFYLANGVLFPLLVAPWIPDVEPMRARMETRLGAWFGAPSAAAEPSGPLLLLLGGALFVAFDLGRWLAHRLQHRIPWLWAFHSVHHSAEVLTPVTTFRVHPVDLAVMATGSALTTAPLLALIAWRWPASGMAAAGVVAATALFVFDIGGSLLRHSSLHLGYGRWLERVLISPAQHRLHHSTAPEHRDRNFGFALAIWDAWAGTLCTSRRGEPVEVGLEGGSARHRSLLHLYLVPFVDVCAMASRALRAIAPSRWRARVRIEL
jgi:sterol desaturase/sphingolipid hydroxylase (fatty acid hydroxylase superfamily)